MRWDKSVPMMFRIADPDQFSIFTNPDFLSEVDPEGRESYRVLTKSKLVEWQTTVKLYTNEIESDTHHSRTLVKLKKLTIDQLG
jgi:hypothetical protein